MRRERVMNSCGGFPMRAGRRRVGSEAVDPIGVALSITAGERSHPRTETPHHSDPMGVELHADVVLTAGCRPVCVGFSAASIRRAAASLLRGCACCLPAVIDVGPLWGPHIYMLPFRRFAFGSPAVIESSPPMGAQASRSLRTLAVRAVRDAMNRVSTWRISHAGEAPVDCLAQLLFNTENRIFSRDCSVARKYAKIRNC